VTVATASLKGRRYHIHDRDPLLTTAFLATLESVVADLEAVRDQQRAHLQELEEIERTFDHDEYPFPYLTLLRGKANAAADAAWAEQALALLERRR